jgi:hypothetical protein
MGKTNWKRVFLGGLLAGVILLVFSSAVTPQLQIKEWKPVMESLGHFLPGLTTLAIGDYVFGIVFSLVIGILAVWLYSVIRLQYGAGLKTAVITGIVVWILGPLSFDAISASLGLFPAKVLVIDGLTALVMYVAATLAGAWVYKEKE